MRFRFDRFELDSSARLLRRQGEPVALTPKAFALLELLLQKRPAVVDKNEILDALWPDAYVAEANVPNLVAEIRTALRDRAKKSRFIRTAHGAGYAFCGAVTEYGDADGAARTAPQTTCTLVGHGRTILLADGEHVLGRSPECEVHLPGHTISRRHARLRVQGAAAVIEDLESRNGTFVRGQRISAPEALADGDMLRMGEVALRFRIFDPHATTSRLGPRKILGRS